MAPITKTSASDKNEISSPGLFLVDKIYCILASLFFMASAYAQTNDPDPELWITGYLTGGCLLNLLVILTGGGSGVRLLIQAFSLVNAAFLFWWIFSVMPSVDYDDSSLSSIAWSILEKEQGRNMGGLFILFAHVMKLLSLTNPPSSAEAKQAPSMPWFQMVGTLVAAAIIGFATYLWVYYQPDMNKRQGVEHCNNVFDGVFSSSSSSAGEEL